MFRGKYAPISGSIDNEDQSPEAAAAREIREETQLVAHHDLVLEICGQSFSFSDEQAQRSWTVHPFGWLLEADESKIQIDWEHTGWKWFDPQQVLEGSMADQCVPNIHKSLQRVYFGPNGMFQSSDQLIRRSNPAGEAFLETIDGLKTNTEDGARVLATDALRGLLRILKSYQAEKQNTQKPDDLWYALRVAAYHLIYSGRPSMNAAISAAILDALDMMTEIVLQGRFDAQVACDILEACISARTTTSSKIAQAFSTFITDNTARLDAASENNEHDPAKLEQSLNIITISSSSTILAALKQLLQDQAQNTSMNLTIFESRPTCEGASLAASIVANQTDTKPRLNIKLAPESHINLLTTSKAIVLLGADRITSTGHVINKTGSAQLALIARSRECKVVVLSEEDKIAKPQSDMLASYMDFIHKQDGGTLSEDDRRGMWELSRRDLSHGHSERHDAREVYGAWPAATRETLLPYIDNEPRPDANLCVTVDNVYFESVDEAHIDHYISENGEVTRGEILRKSVERSGIEDKLFGNLYD